MGENCDYCTGVVRTRPQPRPASTLHHATSHPTTHRHTPKRAARTRAQPCGGSDEEHDDDLVAGGSGGVGAAQDLAGHHARDGHDALPWVRVCVGGL